MTSQLHSSCCCVTAADLPVTQEIRGWYRDQNAGSSVEIIRGAHDEAVAIFTKVLTEDERKRIWCGNYLSMKDVLDAVNTSKAIYESKLNSKARKWLSILSSRVTHYGGIMDILVQHHPEYTSLAWGAMKFLFIAVMNHEELTKQIAKAFCRIAEILPRTDLILILYPTDLMRDAVAHLYAQIIKFLQKAVTWYKKGKLAHAWGSIAKPWALNFQDNVEDIKDLSQRVDELASTAEKAELRDVHREVLETRGEVQLVHSQIQNLRKVVGDKFEEMLQIVTKTRALQQRMHLDLSDQSEMIRSIQLTEMLSLSFMCNLPTSGESLGYCQSVRTRGSMRTTYRLPELSTLEKWSSEPRTSMLLTQISPPQAAKSFLVDLVMLIQQNKLPIIWALRFPNFWDKKPTFEDMLRMLIIQAIQINPSAISGLTPITAVHLREASSAADWLNILKRTLTGMTQVYLVIDSDLLSLASMNSTYQATRMIEKFPEILTGVNVKVVVSMTNIDQDYVTRNWDPKAWSKLQTGSVQRRGFVPGRSARRQRKIRSRVNHSGPFG